VKRTSGEARLPNPQLRGEGEGVATGEGGAKRRDTEETRTSGGKPVMQEESGATPTYVQLMELYKIAVDEYRFQVNLNAQRSRDYFVLNSAIIASAVALLGQKANILAGSVFSVGFLVAVMTGLGFHTQHNYYRETQATKRQLESRLGIQDGVVKTTPSAGSLRRRIGSVTQFNYSIITLLCLVNILGALFSFSILPLPTKKALKAAEPTMKTSPALKSPRLQPSESAPLKPVNLPAPRGSRP